MSDAEDGCDDRAEAVLAVCVAAMAFGAFVSHTLVNTAFVCACLILIHRAVKRGWRTLVTLRGLDRALILYAASFLVSAVFGADPAHSLRYLTELKRPVIAYVAVNGMATPRDLSRVLGAAVAGGVISTIHGFHQYLAGATVTIHHVTTTFAPHEMLRVNGLSSTCNELAFLLMMALGLVAYPFVFSPVSRTARGALGLTCVVLAAGLLRTLTVSGFLGFLGGFALVGARVNPRRTIVALALLAVVYPGLPGTLRMRHFQIYDPNAAGQVYRRQMVAVTIDMLRQAGPLGIGRRNFTAVHARMYPGGGEAPHAHNNYLNVLAEQGVAGLAALVWFTVALLGYLARALDAPQGSQLETATLGGVSIGLVAFLLAGLFHFTWGDALPVALMWIFVGIAHVIGEQRLCTPAPRGTPARD